MWQVKDKDEKYNFRNNSKTCVENIKIAIQESKFIHAKESKGNKLSFFLSEHKSWIIRYNTAIMRQL